MALQMNDKTVTTNELVRTVICSVLEDLENNFDSYAQLYCKNYNTYSNADYEKIEQWKTKIFDRLNQTVKREGLLENR